jgi:uncharacterized protein (TIGR02996 family)
MGDDDAAGLEALIEVWRRTRHPRPAALADRLGARLGQAHEPLGASGSRADRERWWEVHARMDPVDLPRLAAAARGGSQDEVGLRVAALAERGDPRFAASMLRLLEDPPYAGVRSRGLLTQILDAIRAAGDRRVVPMARDLAARFPGIVPSSTGGWTSERLEAVAAALEALPEPRMDPEDEQHCARWDDDPVALTAGEGPPPAYSASEPQGARTLASLLGRVYASPEADEPRLVYADLLLEQGDPRGHFIALQVRRAAGHDTPADRGLEQALTHDPARLANWSHPLGNAGACRFERGFVAHVDLYRTLPERLIGDAAWSTVVAVSGLEKVSLKRARALLEAPSARGIRSVSTPPGRALLRLCDRTWGFRALQIGEPDPLRATMYDAFPELRSLGLASGAVDASLLAERRDVRSLALFQVDLPQGWARLLDGLDELEVDLDEPPAELPVPSLRRLSLRWFRGRLAPWTGELPALRALELHGLRQAITPEHVPTGLEELTAPRFDLPAGLLERMPKLRVLRAQVPMSAVPALPLREVEVTGAADGLALAALLERCPSLHTVTLRTGGDPAPAAVRALVDAQRAGGLSRLEVSGQGVQLAVTLGPEGLLVEGRYGSEVGAMVDGWGDIAAVTVTYASNAEVTELREMTGAAVYRVG